MPWKVEKGHGCSPGKPWAVINQSSGAREGCHATKQGALDQAAALYANEPRGQFVGADEDFDRYAVPAGTPVDEAIGELLRFNPNHGKGGKFTTGGGGLGGVAGAIDTSNLAGGTGPIEDGVAEEHLQDVFDRAKGGAAFDEGMSWYSDAHDAIGQRAAKLGEDPATLTGMVAATSPQTQWETKTGRLLNVDLAEKAVMAARAYPGKTGAEVAKAIKSPGMLRNSLTHAVDIHNGVPVDQALKGPKTRSFYNNLSFPNGTQDVTVDRHMIAALAGHHNVSEAEARKYADSHYGWSADRIRDIATTNKVTPAQAQAIIWTQWQSEGGDSVSHRTVMVELVEQYGIRPEEWAQLVEARASEWQADGDPLDVDEDQALGGVFEEIDEAELLAFLDEPLPESRFNPNHGKGGKFSTGHGGAGAKLWGGGLPGDMDPETAAEMQPTLDDLQHDYSAPARVKMGKAEDPLFNDGSETMAYTVGHPFEIEAGLSKPVITLNPAYFGAGNRPALTAALAKGNKIRTQGIMQPSGKITKITAHGNLTETPGDVLTHEYGHALDFSMPSAERGLMQYKAAGAIGIDGDTGALKSASKLAHNAPSLYGASDQTESIAEAFVAYRKAGGTVKAGSEADIVGSAFEETFGKAARP